jgi:GntR family transcriptional regulator / MocR family aminotransferase
MEYALNRIKASYLQAQREKGAAEVLYDLIFQIIRDAIQADDLPRGSSLPSTRLLAQELGVSRSTIVQVYDLLKVGSLIESRPGAGYRVSKVFVKVPEQDAPPLDWGRYPALSETGKSFLGSLPLLETTMDEETAFRPGLPPLDIFPVNQWKILSNSYWRHVKDDQLSYVSNSGAKQLREALASYLNYTRKIKCTPQQIIVVSGSLQSLYIIGNTLLNPGDHIAHENPTFPNVISIFKGLRAQVHPVPVDQEGLMVSALPQKSAAPVKIVHAVPSCHYPTGKRMSLARRLELLQWAREHGSIIIENDYEHEVNNYQDFIPSIYSLDQEQRTFFLGTFNRLLHPSIRIGYMVVPLQYLGAMEALLRYLHRFVPNSKQMVLSQFIEKNFMYNHVLQLIAVAERRRALFCAAFRESFDGAISIDDRYGTRSLHVLAELPAHIPDQKLVKHFRAYDIAAHAYSKTFVGEAAQQGLVLGYAPVNTKDMLQKIQKMKKLYQEFKRSRC